MTDNSNFPLLLDIDRATLKSKVESEVLHEGGFKWTAAIERRADPPNDKAVFTLRCEVDDNESWKCEGEVNVYVRHCNGHYIHWIEDRFCYDENISLCTLNETRAWNFVTHYYDNGNNKINIVFRIHITSKRGEFDPTKFASPNTMSNVILKIGDEKLHVSREYLAVHSPFFEKLFFGDFVEKGKEEVEIKDVVYDEFIDLLHVIYPGTVVIKDRTVQHLLKLADRFQMERVVDQSKRHLMQSQGFDVMTKLILADQYKLTSLRDQCLQTYTTVTDVTEKLNSSPEYANFTECTKSAICDRIMKLSLQMTDNSNFVLRWEVDNATARFATGKVESEMFDDGGFKWICGVERRTDPTADRIDFILRCDLDNRKLWKCEGEVDVKLFHARGASNIHSKLPFDFNGDDSSWLTRSTCHWSNYTSSTFNINDKVTMEFHIHIVNSERGEPITDLHKFAEPNNRSDVILKIGDKKLHVSKEYLAIHSPVFETMFFGDFAEKGKEEVEIKDVVYEEFLDILHLIYPGTTKITDRTVQHILKLADRFQMESVIDLSNEHLMQSKGLDAPKKLLLADQYRLVALRDHCLQSFTTSNDIIQKLKSAPEFANYSADMKAAICERIMKLNLQ